MLDSRSVQIGVEGQDRVPGVVLCALPGGILCGLIALYCGRLCHLDSPLLPPLTEACVNYEHACLLKADSSPKICHDKSVSIVDERKECTRLSSITTTGFFCPS